MGRSRRTVIDQDDSWVYRAIYESDVSESADITHPADYIVLTPFVGDDGNNPGLAFALYSSLTSSTKDITVWARGLVSLGPVTQEQIDFINNANGSTVMSDFPGPYIGVGFLSGIDEVFFGVAYGGPTEIQFRSLGNTIASIVMYADHINVQGALAGGGIDLGTGVERLRNVDGDYSIDLRQLLISEGTPGADTLIMSTVPQTLDTGAGDDTILTRGSAIVHAGDGNDSINFYAGSLGRTAIHGDTGTDTLIVNLSDLSKPVTFAVPNGSSQSIDALKLAYDGIEKFVVVGTAGNDSLEGGSGDDGLNGGAGADVLIGGPGNDTLDSGTGGQAPLQPVTAGGSSQAGALNLDELFSFDSAGGAPYVVFEQITDAVAHYQTDDWFAFNAGGGAHLSVGFRQLLDSGSFIANYSITLYDESGQVVPDVIRTGVGLEADLVAGRYFLEVTSSNTSANLASLFETRISLTSAAPVPLHNVLTGGEGDDTYVVHASDDVAVEIPGEGYDQVISDVTWQLGSNFEMLTLAGSGAINGTGNALNNVLTGNAASNVMDGSTGDDTLTAGAGDDNLSGGPGNDILDGGAGTDTAVFAGARSNYSITWSATNSTFTVTSTAEGTDTLTGIETFTFSDGSYAASTFQVSANTAPTLSTISTLTGGEEDTAYTVTYAALAAAADVADADGNALSFRVEAVSSGTLTKGGVAVTAGTTTLASGESLVWTPALNANGTLNAFTVKATDGALASAAAVPVSVQVAAVNDAPTGGLTITGSATQGQTLTATNTLADADGIPASGTGAFSYQWQANGQAISGATADTYTLTQAEVGKTINVTASYTDSQGVAESVTSTATAAVANVNDVPAGSVTISGTARQGQTLTAANTLEDADGMPHPGTGRVSYQWRADGATVFGASGSTFTLTAAEVGKVISVTATYVDGLGTDEAVTSAATAVVAVAGPGDSVPPAYMLAPGSLYIGESVSNLRINPTGENSSNPVQVFFNDSLVYSGVLSSISTPASSWTFRFVKDIGSNYLPGTSPQFHNIYGGSSTNEIIVGTEGSDWIEGFGGSDIIFGLGDDDNLWGNEGDDSLYGGLGGDSLYGGLGSDQLLGELGNDSINSDGLAADSLVDGGLGTDYIEVNTKGTRVEAHGDQVSAYYYGDLNGTFIDFTDGAAQVYIDKSAFGSIEFHSTSGAGGLNLTLLSDKVETIFSGPVGLTAVTLTYNDYQGKGPSSWSMPEGVSQTWLSAGGPNATPFNLNGNSLDNRIIGSAGTEIIKAGGGSDYIWDNIGWAGAQGGRNELYGEAGNDTIVGGPASLVDGGTGDDVVQGNSGSEIYGGIGYDTYIFDYGISTIMDYELGERLVLDWITTSNQPLELNAPTFLSIQSGVDNTLLSIIGSVAGSSFNHALRINKALQPNVFSASVEWRTVQWDQETFGYVAKLIVTTPESNSPPTGGVQISGTPEQGQQLTLTSSVADADGLGAVSYQWKADGTAIAGAGAGTFTLTQAEVGKTISVTLFYTDGLGIAESVTSSATSAVVNVNDNPTGSVTISGTATQGQTLTAANTLADVDGIPASGTGAISYQWKANGEAISGTTANTYTLTQAEVGKTITVAASYTDSQGTAESVPSTATAAVANVNDEPAGTVTIVGTPTQGQTLTAANTLADSDGLGNISYQWLADSTPISGATTNTYTLTQAQVGKTITVTASYTDSQGTAESVISNATAAVANVNDLPAITSAAQAGEVFEDSTLNASGQVSAEDIDDGASLTFYTADTATYGTFSIDSVSGKWSYTLDNGTNGVDGPVQTLSQGQTLTEFFTVTVADEFGATDSQTVSVTITGVNDAPVVNASPSAGGDGVVTVEMGVGKYIIGLLRQSDQKIVLVGTAETTNGLQITLARLSEDGFLDTSFGTDGKVEIPGQLFNFTVSEWALDSNGRVVFAGQGSEGFKIGRYNQDGTLDSDFGQNGYATVSFSQNPNNDRVQGLVIQSDGRIIVAGSAFLSSTDFAIARFNQDGALDNTFGVGGKVTTNLGSSDNVHGVGIKTNGEIVVAGTAGNGAQFSVAVYESDGRLKSTAITQVGNYAYGESGLVLLDDGKILVAGRSDENFAMVRYQEDLSLDDTFGSGGKVIESSLFGFRGYDIRVQSDGGILVAGSKYVSGEERHEIVRFNHEGTLDQAFTGQDLPSETLAGNAQRLLIDVLENGRFLIAGNILALDDSDFWVARFDAEGVLDSTFGGGSAENIDGILVEDASDTVYGQVIATDIDDGASITYSTQETALYGTFELNAATGAWVYTLDNGTNGIAGAVQSLAQGQALTESFIVTASDAFGATDSQTVSVTILGRNDAPTGSVTINGTPTQGQTLTAANTLADLDGIPADGPSTLLYQWNANGTAIAGANGSSYVLTQAQVGKTITVTASYTDNQGTAESVTSSATAAVVNVDDEATGTLGVTGTAEEGGSLTASLTAISDADGSTSTAYQWQENTGTAGAPVWTNLSGNGADSATLTIPSDQSYVGKSVRVVATTTDELDGTTEFMGPALSITNANDPPVINSADQTGSVTEDGTLTASGQISASDIDDNALLTFAFSGSATYGTFSLDSATGAWTYTLQNGLNGAASAVQALAQGQTLTESFAVTVADEFGASDSQTVTITIGGSNDAPVILTPRSISGYSLKPGTPSTENLIGSDINEIFIASRGSDYVDGRGGVDIVVVSGSPEDYIFEWGNNSLGASGNGNGSWLHLQKDGNRVSIKVSDRWYNFGETIAAENLLTEFIVFADQTTAIASVAGTWATFGSGVGDFQLALIDNASPAVAAAIAEIPNFYGGTPVATTRIIAELPSNLPILGLSKDGTSIYTLDYSKNNIIKYSSLSSDSGSLPNAQLFGGIPQPFNQIYGVSQFDDGSVIIGLSQHKSGNFENGIAKINSDGSLNQQFGDSGVATLPSINPTLNLSGSYISSEGHVYALGTNNWGGAIVIYRLTVNGEIDNSFGANGLFEYPIPNPSYVTDFITLESGKSIILVSVPNMGHQLIGLNSDGSIDVHFGQNGIYAIPDTLYTQGSNYFSAQSLYESESGVILVSGLINKSAINWPAYSQTVAIRAVSELGQEVQSFGSDGLLITDLVSSGAMFGSQSMLHILSDGGFLILGGEGETTRASLYNAQGSLDTSFGTQGHKYFERSSINSIAAGGLHVSVDGTLTLVGYSNSGTVVLEKADEPVAALGVTPPNGGLPTVNGSQYGTVSEDNTLITSGQVTARDIDNNAILTFSAEGLGAYGGFTIDVDTGVWAYTLSNGTNGTANPVQSLGLGATRLESFTVTVSDEFGATDSQLITVTVEGANDAPVAQNPISVQVAPEDGLFSLTVPVDTFVDIDDGDHLSFTAEREDGTALPAWLSFYNLSGTFSGTPVNGDVGSISIKLIATDSKGLSASTVFELNVTNADDEATGTLGVTGTTEEGGSLTANLASVSDADGSTSTAYQWQENTGSIDAPVWKNLAGNGAATATLTIPDDQTFVGKSVRVAATTTDVLGGTTEFAGQAQIITNVNDAPTGAVSISGTATQGQTLTVENTLADADGIPDTGPGAIRYQWKADGVAIAGANDTTLPLTQSHIGKTITVTVSYTDGGGTAESLTSAPTTAVSGTSPPANTAPVLGTAPGKGKAIVSVGAYGDVGTGIAVQPDGGILVAGSSVVSYRDGYPVSTTSLIRLLPNGQLDSAFMSGGKTFPAQATTENNLGDLLLQPDGKIVLLGHGFPGPGGYDFSLLRLLPDGSADTSFGSAGQTLIPIGNWGEGALKGILQPDGKIVAIGILRMQSEDIYDFAAARVNADGTLDTSFGNGGSVRLPLGSNSEISTGGFIQPDGKIVLTGWSVVASGMSYLTAVRLLPDGSLDASFGTGGKAFLEGIPGVYGSESGYGSALLPDGKMLLAGVVNPYGDFCVVRLNADGSIDGSFGSLGTARVTVGNFVPGFYPSMHLQPDGAILLAGSVFQNGQHDLIVVRLTSDGALDSSFGTGGKSLLPITSVDDVSYDIALQPDGKILLSGVTATGMGRADTLNPSSGQAADFLVVRLNSNGTLDTSFNSAFSLIEDTQVGYTEDGPAVTLNPRAAVFDAELSALNGGAGNYAGASITLQREGGASAEDQFPALGRLVYSSGKAYLPGEAPGSVVEVGALEPSSGQLRIVFNDQATQARVDEVLSSLGYTNTSNTPPSTVAVQWRFDDGNEGAQGSAGALNATAVTTVRITAKNDTPTGSVTISGTATQGQTLTAANTLADADGIPSAGPGSMTYQWKADGANIPGAADSTFTLTQAEVGKTISVTASYVDLAGTTESVGSAATETVTDTGGQETPSGLLDVKFEVAIPSPGHAPVLTVEVKVTPDFVSVGMMYGLIGGPSFNTGLTFNPASGYFTFSRVLDPHTASGRYQIYGLGGTDAQGNSFPLITNANFSSLDAFEDFLNPGGDNSAPVIEEIYLDAPDYLSDGLIKLKVHGKAKDIGASGLPSDSWFDVWLSGPGASWPKMGATLLEDGSFSGELILPKHTPSGTYSLIGVGIMDRAWNLGRLYFENGPSVTVENPLSDPAPPLVTHLKLSAVPAAGTDKPQVIAQGSANDDVSGLNHVFLRLLNPAGQDFITSTGFEPYTLQTDFELGWLLGVDFVSGLYRVIQLDVSDKAGNGRTWNESDVQASGLPGTISLLGPSASVGGRTDGTELQDFIFGVNATADGLFGAAGADVLYAFAGQDTLSGGAGNDTLHGGEGSDTAIFTGQRAEYLIVSLADEGMVRVTDTVSGRDGEDSLLGVEILRFADGDLQLGNNSAPQASAGSYSTPEDSSLNVSLPAASDADGDPVTYAKASDPAHGNLTIQANGNFSYTPVTNFHGQDSFSFSISDGRGGSNTYTASLTVSAVNDLPVGTVNIAGTPALGQTLTATNTLTDADGIPSSGAGALTYQWKADGTDIPGATGSTFSLTQAQVGKTVTVTASYVDGMGQAESVQSAATQTVAYPSTTAQGLVYHWKTHALLSGVDVAVVPAKVEPISGDLLALRDAVFDATTRILTVDVWTAAAQEFANFDFRVQAEGATGAQFDFSSLPGGWTVLPGTKPQDFRVSGFSLNEVSGSTKLGTLQLTLPAGAQNAVVNFAQVSLGNTTGTSQKLVMQSEATGTDGSYSFTVPLDTEVRISASRAANDSGNALSSADALAALRIAVGLNPNLDPDGAAGPRKAPAISPYQIIAADANQDGKVSSADALAILRMVVELETALPQQWLFVEETRDFWDEKQQKFTLTRSNAAWDHTITANPALGPVNLVGILKGDVNGDWPPPPNHVDLDIADPSHFERLAEVLGVPNHDLWGGGP